MLMCNISFSPERPSFQEVFYKSKPFQGGCFFYDSRCQILEYGSCGEYFAVIFGRIHNFDELLDGSNCVSLSSNLEKLDALKKIYGNQLAEILRGDFILALVKLETLEVELVKSPFSAKRLYYVQRGSNFIFSSALSVLKKMLPEQCGIDREKFIDALAGTYHFSDRSYYQGVMQLEGGQVLNWAPREAIKKRVFWVARDLESPRSLSAYVDGLKEHFDRAVQRRLLEDDRACCQISGGLDSTSVAGVLAKKVRNLTGLSHYTKAVNTAGLKIPETETNESLLSDFEAMYFNSKIQRYDSSLISKNYSELSRFCFEHSDGPELAPNNVLWLLSFYEAAFQLGFNKIFSGRCGDLAFSFHNGGNSAGATGWFRLVRSVYHSVRSASIGKAIFRPQKSPPLLKKEIFSAWEEWPGLLLANQELTQKRMNVLNLVRRYASAATNLDAAALNQFGVELCDPTADLDLIEYCLSIPTAAYQQQGINRYITREAIRGIVPESVRLNRVKGIQGAHWYIPLKRELNYYQSLFPKFYKNDLIKEVVDLKRLEKLFLEFSNFSPEKLGQEHRFNLVRSLHICEWAILHDA